MYQTTNNREVEQTCISLLYIITRHQNPVFEKDSDLFAPTVDRDMNPPKPINLKDLDRARLTRGRIGEKEIAQLKQLGIINSEDAIDGNKVYSEAKEGGRKIDQNMASKGI